MGEWVWIPRQPIVPLRAEPSHRSEKVSELLWGEPQQIVQEDQNWLQVRSWLDGYTGWVETGALIPAYLEEGDWQIVYRPYAPLFHNGRLVGRLSPGALFPPTGSWRTATGDWTTPYIRSIASPLTLSQVIRHFKGVPYEWGGRSPAGIDCSGLIQILYRLLGKFLPRDAYQQAEATLPISQPQQGDLVFFTQKDSQRISHVALYLGKGYILHATPAQGVHIAFMQSLYTHTFHSFRTLLIQDFVI